MRGTRLIKTASSYQQRGVLKISPDIILSVIRSTQLYSKFIPWCSESLLVKKSTIKNTPISNFTCLKVKFGGFCHSYTSKVTISSPFPHIYKVTSHSTDSPLKYLHSEWVIKDISPSTHHQQEGLPFLSSLEYNLNFEFNSLMMQIASSAVHSYLGSNMWEIFLKRIKLIDEEKKMRPGLFSLLDQSLSRPLWDAATDQQRVTVHYEWQEALMKGSSISIEQLLDILLKTSSE